MTAWAADLFNLLLIMAIFCLFCNLGV